MSGIGRDFACIFGCLAALAGTPAGAQESLDKGKTPAQLFASDCAICHKSPQGLARTGGVLGLDNFLREHYTASRESAAAIAAYLQSMGNAPAPARGGATKRSAKGDDSAKGSEKKSEPGKSGDGLFGGGIFNDGMFGGGKTDEVKTDDAKSGDKKRGDRKPSQAKRSTAKSSDTKPSDANPPEAKPADAKPAETKSNDAKPAETPKSD